MFLNNQKNLPKVGLVLSGGAARGLAHVGVISILEEYKIPIDLIVCASFGSLVGGYYAYGYSIEEMLTFARAFRLWSIRDFKRPWNGIFSGDKEETIFENDIGDARIESLKIPLYILAADLSSQRGVVFENGRLTTAMRASTAFPGLFAPFQYENHIFIDGGIMGSLPVETAHEKGADVVIFSDVSILSMIYRKKISKTLFNLLLRWISKRKKRPDSKISKTNLRSILYKTLCIINKYKIINTEPDFLVEPLDNEIKPLRFSKVDDGYKLGREATLKTIDAIVKRIYKK